MTLIYARKLPTLTYIIADTFSEITLTKEKFNWFSQPIRKIFSISDKYVVAFSGNSHRAMSALRIALINPPNTLNILGRELIKLVEARATVRSSSLLS